jgi:hypothetical protein
MSSGEVECDHWGASARVLSLEGEVFPRHVTERPMLFVHDAVGANSPTGTTVSGK